MIFLVLILLHSPDGHVVLINPAQVTTLRPREGKGHFTEDANCLINLTDGKFVAVIEHCDRIQKMLEAP